MSTLLTLFGSRLVKGPGHLNTSEMEADVIGLYFSAHWCPPCRKFTPVLAARYKELQSRSKSFEVIFVSSDRDEAQFQEYFRTMPWPAIPFDESNVKQTLTQLFKVNGIPTLVLIDRSGKLLDRSGREKIMIDAFVSTIPEKTDREIRGLSLETVLEAINEDPEMSSECKVTGLKVLIRILSNIIQNPGDPKYLSLRKDNESVQKKLGNPTFIKILKISGFREEPDCYRASECPDTSKMKDVREVLNSLIESMES